jgi:hypothetical protein
LVLISQVTSDFAHLFSPDACIFLFVKVQNLVSTQRKEEEAEDSRQNGSKPSDNNFVQCEVNGKLPASRDPKFYATPFPFFFSYENRIES